MKVDSVSSHSLDERSCKHFRVRVGDRFRTDISISIIASYVPTFIFLDTCSFGLCEETLDLKNLVHVYDREKRWERREGGEKTG